MRIELFTPSQNRPIEVRFSEGHVQAIIKVNLDNPVDKDYLEFHLNPDEMDTLAGALKGMARVCRAVRT